MTAAASTAESTGRLIEQIDEFIGEGATLSMDTNGTVFIHRLDPQRFPLLAGRDLSVTEVTEGGNAGTHLLYARATTLLGALQAAAAYLVFPPQVADAHLRLVGGAS